MNEPIKITATLPAWLPSWNSGAHFLANVKDGKHLEAINQLHYSTSDMGTGKDPWSHVGEAEITLTLKPKDDIVAAQLQALNAELANARAEWMTKQQGILDRISKLQALDYVEAE